MPRTIYVNARFSHRQVTGVERYAGEVINRMGDGVKRITPKKKSYDWSGHLWEQVQLPRLIGEDDLLWSPANTGPLKLKNQVATVHDLSPLEHPEWFNNYFAAWYGYLIPRLLKAVSMIITISEFTKWRMIELLNIPEKKIIVAPGGVDRMVFHPVEEEEIERICRILGIQRPYILMIQPGNPRKNVELIFKVWEIIRRIHLDIQLVLLGAGGKVFDKVDLSHRSKAIIRLSYVDDQKLTTLLSGASVFVYPSLYEGFGLSVLEAMACGTPVVASNAGGLPEAVGEGGYLFDPADIDDFVQGIQQLLTDTRQRNDFIRKGFQRVNRYSWDTTVRIIDDAIGIT